MQISRVFLPQKGMILKHSLDLYIFLDVILPTVACNLLPIWICSLYLSSISMPSFRSCRQLLQFLLIMGDCKAFSCSVRPCSSCPSSRFRRLYQEHHNDHCLKAKLFARWRSLERYLFMSRVPHSGLSSLCVSREARRTEPEHT